jgi:ribonuclease HIII
VSLATTTVLPHQESFLKCCEKSKQTTLSIAKEVMASRNRPQKPFTVCGYPRVRIPESCRGKEIVIGIDEAGRGPVLGSLVYCAAFGLPTKTKRFLNLVSMIVNK